MDLGPTLGDGTYAPRRRTFKLVFEDDHPGLVVRCRSAPVGRFLELGAMAASMTGGGGDAGAVAAQMEAVGRLFATFGDVLTSWNIVDDDGVPVPATAEGLLAQDMDLAMRIVMEWIKAVAGVSAPLGPGSTDGSPSGAASIPMVSPSSSP